ncbi:MAG: sensor histidine kinase, partial [Pyrinomonadaceae bacterium]
MDRQRLARPFMLLIIGIGAAVFFFSAFKLPFAQLDALFLLLATATVAVTSRVAVRVPGVNGRITISETFVFLTMLLYGGEAAIVLAAADGFCASRLVSRKPITLAYNAALTALSTFITVWVLRFFFGPITALPHGPFSAEFMIAVCVMALVQYFTNSVLAAVAQALKSNERVWQVWVKYCAYTSITYFAGASAAAITAKLVGAFGFYAIIATTPILAIIYLTYRTYLKNIEVMAAAARAEAAQAQAEQAQRHIGELNQFIAEKARIREQYAQIEKLSALGELASGVAHDFNNTLAGILGRAQLLQGTNDTEKIQRGLEIIIKTARDGAKTIKRIQDFARQRRDYDFHLVSVDQLLLDVSEMTRPRWKTSAEAASVHINLDLQLGAKSHVLGDESELREVLVNMVFNAVDAMPAGGTLTLSADEADGAVVITVKDTGMGMSDEVRSRIFDPFYTTKGKAGMGLGLAVSYGIVRRHEGTFEVESEPGRGTSMRLRLPTAKGGLGKPQSGELRVVPAADGRGRQARPGMRFLVVEDEEPVRDLLR